MTPPSDRPYELEVSRADLVQALKIIARAIRKYPGDASLRFEGGCLSIEGDSTVADAPASGTWPCPVFVSALWVRRLARRMPAGDPIRLRVDAGRLHLGRYSEPCAWTPREQSGTPEPATHPAPATIDDGPLLAEAARILKPLFIKRSDLETLVAEARARGPAAWTEEEAKMTALVARAWVKLAPLGVETADIRRLVNDAVRNAWK